MTDVLKDLFTPETGVWHENVRNFSPEGLKELRESMGQLGWLRQLPAIKDENGVVIVGHRRLKVAEELGIEPVIETVRFGDGDAADAARAALAIASNVGAEKFSPADRAKIAKHLHLGGSGWTMVKIGELLNVSAMTVSRDLRDLTPVKSTDKPKRGRPRKPKPVAEKPITLPFRPATSRSRGGGLTPPGGVTDQTPGPTDRAAEALAHARAAESAPAEPDSPPADFIPYRFVFLHERRRKVTISDYVESVVDIALYDNYALDLATPVTADDLPADLGDGMSIQSDAELARSLADDLRAALPRIHDLIAVLDERAGRSIG